MPSESDPSYLQDIEAETGKKRWGTYFHSLFALFSGSVAREGYLASIDQGIISLSNFTATIILARNVSPTELGVYGVGFTILRLARAFQEGLIVQPVNVFGAAMDEASFRQYATSSSLFQIVLALISALAAALGGWLLTSWGNDTAGPALFSLWLPLLFWQLQDYIRRLFYTRGSIVFAVVNTTIANTSRLILMLWLAYQDELSGTAGLFAIGFGSLLALLPGLWFTRSYWSRHYANLKETWGKNWGFGRWVLGGTVSNWLSVEFYPILTAGMVSFAAAGAYRAIQNLVAPIHLLLRAIDTFFTPRATKFFKQGGMAALNRPLRLTYLIAGIPIIGILVFAIVFRDQLLYLLYGDTYLPYSDGVILMAIFYALWFSYWPLQSAFKATQIARPIFIGNILAIVLMFTVGVWAIHQWGVYGTIAGQALNALVVSLVLWTAWISLKRKS